MKDVPYVRGRRRILNELSYELSWPPHAYLLRPRLFSGSCRILRHTSPTLTIPDAKIVPTIPLHEIIVLTICAVICGADGFTSIASFGQAKKDWLGRFLELENGIPSHGTIGRLFGLLDPEAFEACFSQWIEAACEHIDGEVVAIDGKTLRRSYDRQSKKATLHMVSAWASENGLALGQVKTEEKSNEITAIPELLEVLSVSGCIVTIDAMDSQKAITEAITDEGADYVLALKGNQGEADTEAIFERLCESESEPPHVYKSVTGGHDRVETQRCWAVDVEDKGLVDQEGWHELSTVCMVEHERLKGGEKTTERRYFVKQLAGRRRAASGGGAQALAH